MSRALAKHLRRAHDDYPTPAWASLEGATIAWEVARAVGGGRDCDVLEPTCGEGAIINSLLAVGFSRVRGIEINTRHVVAAKRKGYDVTYGDTLKADWGKPFLVVTNPPFGIAEEVVRKALLSGASAVVMLLRLAFLETAERFDFNSKNPLSELHVLSSRPSFMGNGGSDSAAYGWLVWTPQHVPDERRFFTIAPHLRERWEGHKPPAEPGLHRHEARVKRRGVLSVLV